MQSALRITTKVLPGNKIEVQLPPDLEGKEVNVFIILPEKPKVERRNVMEIMENARKRRAGRTAEDIDLLINYQEPLIKNCTSSMTGTCFVFWLLSSIPQKIV